MKYYEVKAYKVEENGKAKFIGDVIVEKHQTLPIIGEPKIEDAISKFQYALLTKNKDEVLMGQRPENMEKAGFDIGVFINDINDQKIATIDQIMNHQETFPVSRVSEEQSSLNFALNMKLGNRSSKKR